jgi:hypothetical protein
MHAVQFARGLLSGAALVGCSPAAQGDARGKILAPEFNVSDASSGPSAEGHGNWINAAGEYVSRTFSARDKDGVVDGNFVQHVTATTGEKRVNKGDIDCLMILGPRDAMLSGPVHENANPALIGATQIFRVQDNGEGSKAVEDAQSALFFRDPATGINCRNFVPPVVTPIVSGNIQVKP